MRMKRRIVGLLIAGVLLLGVGINAYAQAKVASYQDPRSEGVMTYSNQAYESSPKAQGITSFVHSDYPTYYRQYVRVTIYDKDGYVDNAKESYSNPHSIHKDEQTTVSVSVKASSSAKAYNSHTVHYVDRFDGSSYKRYIKSKTLDTYFD